MRPLQNTLFCPISTSGSNFNPRNTQCIPACPVGPADRTGVVKIIAFLELKQKLTFFKGLFPGTYNLIVEDASYKFKNIVLLTNANSQTYKIMYLRLYCQENYKPKTLPSLVGVHINTFEH